MCLKVVQQFKQELSNAFRDLNLFKEAAEVLASRPKYKNCLKTGASVTFYHTREKKLLPYFSEEELV